MKLILLPGKDKSDQPWVQEVDAALRERFDSTTIQDYVHWQKPDGAVIDFDGELEKLVKVAESEHIIFAKSAGVVLTLKGIYEGVLQPKKCIFVGTPHVWCRQNRIDVSQWLQDYATPTLFIQKTRDRAGSSAWLQRHLERQGVKNYEFVELPGKDHDYANVEELKRLIMDYL